MLRFLCLALTLLTLNVPAFAAEDKNGPVPDVPEALNVLVARGAQIRYLGKEHGMDGWIAIYQGQEQYYYVTADKKAFVTGLMFGDDGRPITVEQVKELQAQGGPVLDLLAEGQNDTSTALAQTSDKPLQSIAESMQAQSPAERLFADVENSNWIRLGNENAPVMYAFVDPQCPHCHDMIQTLRKGYLDKGLIQLRIIPVGFQQGSLAQAAFLLAAPNPAELFYRHLDGDANALPVKSDVSTQAIQKNMALMQAWKFNITPLNLYRDKTGKVKIVRGVPKDMNAILADLPPPNTPAPAAAQ